MLLQNPQLSYALLQVMVIMKIIDPINALVGPTEGESFDSVTVIILFLFLPVYATFGQYNHVFAIVVIQHND
jgi:hypothetical protein